MTIEQMIANEETARKEWEASTKVGDYTITELRKVSDAVFNQENWKLPWTADVPSQVVSIVIQATEFFHADKAQVHGVVPITGKVRMSGKGYQAD